jgi:hypothetical protein
MSKMITSYGRPAVTDRERAASAAGAPSTSSAMIDVDES